MVTDKEDRLLPYLDFSFIFSCDIEGVSFLFVFVFVVVGVGIGGFCVVHCRRFLKCLLVESVLRYLVVIFESVNFVYF